LSITTYCLYEGIEKCFEKRFFANHYAYRDFYTTTTGADPTAATASYVFGLAARVVNVRNWPMLGDVRMANELPALNTYARNVMVQCTQDAWIMITSINPRWTRLYIKYLIEKLSSAQAIARLIAEGISMTITEVPHFIPANAMITFRPTMAVAITFYQNTASGTIRIWAEGNTEGME